MTDVLVLYLLAVIDGMFVGYRDAVGRNPRLDKRRYYARAMLQGIGLAHLAMVGIAAAVAATLWLTTDVASTVASLEDVAAILKTIFLFYTAVVALGLSAYGLPSYDLRSYITITVLASLTLLRPLVIIGGAAAAALMVDDPAVWATCATIAMTMAFLQPLLAWLGWNQFDWAGFVSRADTEVEAIEPPPDAADLQRSGGEGDR